MRAKAPARAGEIAFRHYLVASILEGFRQQVEQVAIVVHDQDNARR